jgi:hypothetical protein
MTFLMDCVRNRVVVAAGLAAAVAGLAAAVYKRHAAHKAQLEQLKQLKLDQESAFENRFLKEYDEMANDPDAPVPSSHAHVRETTPQGDVIMSYDADRSMFCYYCDKRSVQFKYLEPVARKYVVEHGCKRLYIDIRQATKATTTTTATTATTATATTATRPPIESVFARLKKYGPSVPLLVPLKDQVTRYWYCGNLNEYNSHSASDANSHDFSIIKPIDYASYKKMNSSP